MGDYIADLENKLHNENDITKRIDLMNDLAWELRRKERSKSLALCNEAYNLSLNLEYQKGIAESYLYIGIHDIYDGNNVEAIEKMIKSYEMFQVLDNIDGKIRALNSMGACYTFLGKNEEAIECLLQGLALSKNTKNYSMTIFFLNNIGELYKTCMNMYSEALTCFFEALDYCKQLDNSIYGSVLNNIADTYLRLGNTKLALEYCQQGLTTACKMREKLTEAQCYKILGKIYNAIGDKYKTQENLKNSLSIYIETNSKYYQSEVLSELGNFFFDEEDYVSAFEYLNKALFIAEEINANANLVNIHYRLAETYEKTNDYQQSVFHYKKYIEINEKVVSIELEKKLNAFIANSEIEQAKKDAEIYKLKNVELKEKSDEIEKKAKELEESYKNIAVISEIGQKITSSLDIETIMNTIYENMNLLMDATIFGLGLYDEPNGLIDYKMFIEDSKRAPHFTTSIHNEKSHAANCIRSRKEVLINDLNNNDTIYIGNDALDENEPVPHSLIYYPLIIEDRIIGTITVQSYMPNSYTWRSLETLKALASYIAIAVNNSQKSEELRKTAEELANTLKNLQDAQAYLVQSEKMVALGQLISGIAHEINTPLGAIQASINNISGYMEGTISKKIPEIFKILTEELQNPFFDMLHNSIKKDVTISSKDERKLKKSLRNQIDDLNIDDSDYIADTLVDMGIYDCVDKYIPLFRHPQYIFILRTCYEISGILRNTENMSIAVSKASKMLYALKNYAHYNHLEVPVETDVIQGIDTVLTLYHNNIKQGTELIKNYGQIPKIKCYADELNQVWTNLIHNALQAMEYKGTLQVDTYLENKFIVVKITDSGCGIPEEIKDKIFDPFFTTKPQGEGSGLGLGIVQEIVKKHHGQIFIDSVPGRTTFIVKLPIDVV